MKRAALALVLLAPSVALAQADPADPGRLFSHVAPVVATGGGYAETHRLPLSADVLAVCRPDLSDVRLYGPGNVEVPWMLDSATRALTPETEIVSSLAAPTMQTLRHEIEGPTRSPIAFHESYELAGPGEPPSRAAWDLVLDASAAHFVTQVRVVAVAADGTEREIGGRGVFRFQAPTRERLTVPVRAPGTDRVRVELTGSEGFLEPTFRWVATRGARSAEALVIPLAIASSVHQGGETILVLARPEGVAPEALRFTTTTTAFLRGVRVETPAQTVDGTIWRVPGDGSIESVDVRVPPARTPTITVRIDDQDSPALEGLTVSAVLARPVLVYFSFAEVLRFGGGRVRAARYDLDALQGSWAIDQLLDGSSTPDEATLGPITQSPAWTNEPALAPLSRPGIAVPPGDHAFAAPLEVSSAREGASRFVLDVATLGAARADLADLRIVDAQGLQWPYLLRDAEPLHASVTPGAPARGATETRYELALPAPIVAPAELRLDPDAPLVSRGARVLGVDLRGDERELGQGSLARYPGQDSAPLSVLLDSGTRVGSLALLVTDGSEAPLAFRSAELVIPTREVVLVAPPGSYRVLVGDDDAQGPTYEIEAVRGLLDTIPIDDAALGTLAANPDHHEPSLWERTGTSTVALWVVLVLAILVLGVLTWRASRSPEASESESEGESEGEGESKSENEGESKGKGKGKGKSESKSKSENEGKSENESKGKSEPS